MAGIFISYRRSDSGGWAGRLSDCLKGELGRVQIFRDIEDIPPGVEFDRYINEAVSSCDVLIALIGPTWLTVKSGNGQRRLENPEDFTRLEIEAALKRNVRVIPALVGGAEIPGVDQLPEDLKPLARRQSYELSDIRWQDDCKKLADVLRPLVRQQSWLGSKKIKTALAVLLLLAALSYGGKIWFDRMEAKARDNEKQEEILVAEAEKAAAEKAAAKQAEFERRQEERAEIERRRLEQAEIERRKNEQAEVERRQKELADLERRQKEAAEIEQRRLQLRNQKLAAQAEAEREASFARMRALHKTAFVFPGDGTPNRNKKIGPFCCTGETAVIRDGNKGRAGYIYFKDFRGGFSFGGGSSGATRLGILVSGRSDLADAKARQSESAIWFSAKELKRGASRTTSAGGLRFKATILSAKLGHSATKGTYYIMGSVKVKVNVSVN